MINIRKVLLICIMVLTLVLLGYTVLKGVNIFGFEVLSYSDMEEESTELDKAVEEYEQKNLTGISSKEDILSASINSFKEQKAQYEEVLKQKQIQLQSINEADCYDIDFIWVKAGNYAKENNVEVELNVTKNTLDAGEEKYILANLNFIVQAYISIGDPNDFEEQLSYIISGLIDEPFKNTADFINDLEEDARLEFEIRDLKMVKEKTKVTISKLTGKEDKEDKDAYILKTTFTVHNVPLNRDTLTILTSKDEIQNESLTQEGKGDVVNVTEDGETEEQQELSNTTF